MGAATLFPQLSVGLNAPMPRGATPALEIGLRLAEPRNSNCGWRRAPVLAGTATGSLVEATVQAGSVEWLVDPISGAVEVAIDLQLVRSDGTLLQLRDRSAHADVAAEGFPGVPTAPELRDAAGTPLPFTRLTGRLDASGLARGMMWLRGFHVA